MFIGAQMERSNTKLGDQRPLTIKAYWFCELNSPNWTSDKGGNTTDIKVDVSIAAIFCVIASEIWVTVIEECPKHDLGAIKFKRWNYSDRYYIEPIFVCGVILWNFIMYNGSLANGGKNNLGYICIRILEQCTSQAFPIVPTLGPPSAIIKSPND